MKQFYVMCCSVFFLNACSDFKDLRPYQIKTTEYFRESGEVKASINEIEEVFLADPNYRLCFVYAQIPVSLKVNTQNTQLDIYWMKGGLTKNHTFSLVEFVQNSITGKASYKIYSDPNLFGKRVGFAKAFVSSFKQKPYILKTGIRGLSR